MLNLPKLKQYAEQLIENSHGILHNVFISNGQNQIIMLAKGTKEETMILSTLLSDSLYVIRINIFQEEEPKEQQPFEVVIQFPQQHAFLYSIENHFIFGVLVANDQVNQGHKISTDAVKVIRKQLENVVEWLNKDAV